MKKQLKTLTELKNEIRNMLKLHRTKRIQIPLKLFDDITQFISIHAIIGLNEDDREELNNFITQVKKKSGINTNYGDYPKW